jgi:hypothetical protein
VKGMGSWPQRGSIVIVEESLKENLVRVRDFEQLQKVQAAVKKVRLLPLLPVERNTERNDSKQWPQKESDGKSEGKESGSNG